MESVRASASRTTAVTASSLEGLLPAAATTSTSVDPGLEKDARDLALPPWNKGRYGTAVGRAVHGSLQTVDLTTGDGIEDAVSAQCLAEGVVEHHELVLWLCRSALASDVVRRAGAREHWRETYVGTVTDDGTIVEGFVDLIYRDDDGSLVVVDYKTDAVPSNAIDARVEVYRGQMAAYVRTLEKASGAVVDRAVLLFLHPEGATARTLPADAMRSLDSLVAVAIGAPGRPDRSVTAELPGRIDW